VSERERESERGRERKKERKKESECVCERERPVQQIRALEAMGQHRRDMHALPSGLVFLDPASYET